MRYLAEVIPKGHARTFIAIICASMAVTFSQGLMIPWMATLEVGQLSPLVNSLSTSAIYGGLLIAMVFVGQLARRLGLRNLVLWALRVGIFSIVLFIFTRGIWWWLVLRVAFGLSLGAIHFGTQAWIGRLTSQQYRGRQMALYGFATGVGFAIGPMFLATGKLAVWLPFALSAAAFAGSLSLVASSPKVGQHHRLEAPSGSTRIPWLYRIALPALALPLVFGFMEAALNGNLPLFAVQKHMPLDVVSASLAAFVIGSLVFQLPLGHLSDMIGRRWVLLGCSAAGVILFSVLPLVSRSSVAFVAACFVVGGFLDTLFSLSLGYLGDLVTPTQLPPANQLAVTHLGLGLMVGPIVGGLAMTWLGPGGLFWMIALLYLLYVIAALLWRPTRSRTPGP